MILDEILNAKRREIAERRRTIPLADLEARARSRPAPVDLAAALRENGVRLIAEIKRASPSKGTLREGLDPVRLALTYATHGAAAISVLTDRYFQGDLEDLEAVSSAVRSAGYTVPVLRKDFLLDPFQVTEARAAGADAVLLIVTALTDEALGSLISAAESLGMTPLIEVHDEADVARALPLHPRVVGINSRRLRDFTIDRDRFAQLARRFPEGTILVAESGVTTAADVQRLGRHGADAVLVGEALVTATDIAARVREMVAGGAR